MSRRVFLNWNEVFRQYFLRNIVLRTYYSKKCMSRHMCDVCIFTLLYLINSKANILIIHTYVASYYWFVEILSRHRLLLSPRQVE